MNRIKNNFLLILILKSLTTTGQTSDSLSASPLFPPVLKDTTTQTSPDMFQLLEETSPKQKEFISATFKGTKIINGESVEATDKKNLQFIIQHRFGALNNGFNNFFGLDNANIRLGLDYGFSKYLSLGIGRSSFQQLADGNFKLKLMRQTKSEGSRPVTIVLYGATTVYTGTSFFPADVTPTLIRRLNYVSQLLIARKFSPTFSLQLMPTVLHRNFTISTEDKNTVFAMGVAARLKLNKRLALLSEYYFTPPYQFGSGYYPHTVAIGVDIETGGHVFQLHFTNATGMVAPQFLGMNTTNIKDGLAAIRFGFNISRSFSLKGKDKQW